MSPSPLKSLNIPFSDSHHFTYFPSSVAQVHPLKQFFNVVETSNPSSLHTLSISLHPLPPSSSFLFLSSINVMVHRYYWSLAKALNSLAALFPRYIWLAKAHPWLNPTIPFCWTLGKNIHKVKLTYLILNSWSQTSNGFKHNPENFWFFSCCWWVKILCAVALIWKKKKGLFVFCNWCDVPLPGLT